MALSSEDYGEHWQRMHNKGVVSVEGNLSRREWHVPYCDLRPFILSHIAHAAAAAGERQHILDVGCGTSALGLELLEDMPGATLTLVDIVDSLVCALRERHGGDARVSAIAEDCRSLDNIDGGSVTVAIDKGTIDAMNGIEDRLACLRAIKQKLQRPHGLFISVSFATASRILLLRREAERCGISLRFRLIPAGPERRLIAMMSEDFGDTEDASDRLLEEQLSLLLFKGPMWDEQYVNFENAALSSRIVLEQLTDPARAKDHCEDDKTGLLVWPAAHALSAHLCAHPELVRGLRVVELGAGTGLAGIVSAGLGASEVVLTDLPGTLPLLQRNVARNEGVTGGRARATELRWGADDGPGGELANFDVVIGCELLYRLSTETYIALVKSMVKLAGAQGVCLFVYEFRGGLIEDVEFFDLAQEHFDVEPVDLGHYGYGISRDTCEDDTWRMLYVYRARR